MAGGVPDIPGERAPDGIVQRLQREVAELLHTNSLSFPGSQPVSFQRSHIEDLLMKEDYNVCEKSDGVRVLMYISMQGGEECTHLVTRRNEYYLVEPLHFPVSSDNLSSFHKLGTIVDGELVLTRSGQLQLLLFDCLVCNGKSLIERPLDKRLGYLHQYLIEPLTVLRKAFPEDCQMFPFVCLFKRLQLASHLENAFADMQRVDYVSDGLIFTPKNRPYVIGTDERTLKWKPANENTVDLLLRLEFPIFEDAEGKYPAYDLKPKCFLDAWMGKTVYKPFSTMYLTDEEWDNLKALNEPLNNRVVEVYQDEQQRWRYMRFREDKEYGNHISVVDKVLHSITDAVSKEELIEASPRIRANWKQRESSHKRRRTSE